MKTIDYVKAYLSFGWSLIPIIPKTKTPPIKWGEYQTKKATLQEVEGWLKKNWYLAVVTGDISGVLVVDDDRVKHNLPEWGFDSSVVSRSKSKGKHYYYKYDREIHSHSNPELRIDLKGWHSYCLLPPFDQRVWVSKPSKNLSTLKPISDEIVRLINSDKKDDKGQREPVRMDDFLNIPDGARNDSLHRIACSIFSKMSKEDGLRLLIGVNQTYSPPLNKKDFDYQVSRAYQFIANKPKKPSVKPLSISEVGERRKEDRELEKDAPSTGYPELDRLVKGFLPKHFWTLTGETNVGKTTFACNLANNVRKQGRKVLYIALEPEYKVVDYLASARLKKDFEELTDSDLDHDDGNIKIFTLAEVPTYNDLIRALKDSSDKYDLVIIDHIGYFCRPEEKSFVVEQGQTIRDLVSLSKEIKTCVMAIAHPRKPTPSQKHRVLNLYDVSGSAAFSQDSTEVIVLHRPLIDTEDQLCVEFSNSGICLVQKSKAGKNGSFKINFHENRAVIESHEQALGGQQSQAGIDKSLSRFRTKVRGGGYDQQLVN